jgi:hypothetical protein
MARLSLWQDGRHSNDYKFMDRRISEMFTIGGTGVLLNKYLGVNSQGTNKTTSAAQVGTGNVLNFSNTSGVSVGDFVYGTGIPAGAQVSSKTTTSVTLSVNTTTAVGSGAAVGFSPDASKPAYINQSEQNIQDLLWLENRDRKYDRDVYKMRGIYQRADQDFDLSQFGLFLQTGTIFMVFHLRDMVDMIGRKLMAGDVLELQHLKDYDALDGDLPAALKRYYVVGDASFASEGFTPTWWPHLWRVKLNPLVDSQEYKDILDNIVASTDPITGNTTVVGDILSTYNKYLDINNQLVAQAEIDVPKSGYNTADFYTLATTNDRSSPVGPGITVDSTAITADNTTGDINSGVASPLAKVQGYLTGDGRAPNKIVTGAGISFPADPNEGEYYLRLDYLPNRLFRFDGNFWRKIEDSVRTNITPGAEDNLTMRSSYVNNTNTYTDASGTVHNERQNLSKALTPKADNN